MDRSSLSADFHDNDTCPLVIFNWVHAEFNPEINDRNNLTSQIDDALQVNRCLRNHGYRHHSDNFLDLQYSNAIFLASQRKRKIFALLVHHRLHSLIHGFGFI
ncbi:MAG: hypothetical protein CSYNP_04479 [Syntrophus sp. SKADARSKE-3]|nr:hypothetical protein [Syntrophus sp. SKADARSKE-3]